MRYIITDRAAALYDGGWRSSDKDELMESYEMTEEEAQEICEELAEVERKVAEEGESDD